MTKKPTKLKDYEPWAVYSRAHAEMMADPKITALIDELETARTHVKYVSSQLAAVEAPYTRRLTEAADAIRTAVLEADRSITSHDVAAKIMKGRASTSWKKVATEAGAGSVLIEKHTRYGPKRVQIEVKV